MGGRAQVYIQEALGRLRSGVTCVRLVGFLPPDHAFR